MVRPWGPSPRPPSILHRLWRLKECGTSGPRGKFRSPTLSSRYGHGGGASGVGIFRPGGGARRDLGRAIFPCGGDEPPTGGGHGLSPSFCTGGSWFGSRIGIVLRLPPLTKGRVGERSDPSALK